MDKPNENTADQSVTDQPIDPKPVDSTNPKLPEAQENKQIMLTGHLARLYSQWTETHGKRKAPLALLPDGTPVWVNRQQRRAQAAARRKGR